MKDHIVDNDSNWFLDLLMELAPNPDEEYNDSTPENMVRSASWRAFGISAGLGLIPGPVGMAVILPEIIAITKLQIDLVYRIAAFYCKRNVVDKTIILLIFGHALGIHIGKSVVEKVGARTVVKTLTSSAVRKIAQNIGMKIGGMAVQKGAGRYIPFVMAPLFGFFSKFMTEEIGREAIELFSREIEIVS